MQYSNNVLARLFGLFVLGLVTISEAVANARNRFGNGSLHKTGYIQIYIGKGKPNAGPDYEHRRVWSDANRELEDGENIHHINLVKHDNRLENLELWVTHQPKGNSVDDAVDYAILILEKYAPHRLKQLD